MSEEYFPRPNLNPEQSTEGDSREEVRRSQLQGLLTSQEDLVSAARISYQGDGNILIDPNTGEPAGSLASSIGATFQSDLIEASTELEGSNLFSYFNLGTSDIINENSNENTVDIEIPFRFTNNTFFFSLAETIRRLVKDVEINQDTDILSLITIIVAIEKQNSSTDDKKYITKKFNLSNVIKINDNNFLFKNINVSIDEINNLSINLYAQDSITTELYDKASFSITQEETLPFINFPDEELPTRSPSQERQERGFSTVAINPRLFIGLVRSDNTSLAATGGLFGNQLGDDDEY
tara:strand:- start:9887 stop:10768 length:882 start_codon:yes stop_codon:yes gene_type:complete